MLSRRPPRPVLGARGLVIATALVGCSASPGPGPAQPGPEAAPPPAVITVRSGDDLARIAALAPNLGGPTLAAWFEASLGADGARLAFDSAAPIRYARLDELGTEVRAGHLVDPSALTTQLTATWPDATRRYADHGALWIDADAIVATHGDHGYLIEGGAASTRLRAALEFADAGGLDGATTEHDLALGIDGEPLVELWAGSAARSPTLAALGRDLGRVTIGFDVADDRVDWTVSVAPRPGTLAERLVSQPSTGAGKVASIPVAIGAALDPTELGALLGAISQPLELNLSKISGDLPSNLSGDVFLGVGGISVGTRSDLFYRVDAAARHELAEVGIAFGENLIITGLGASTGDARAGITWLPAWLLPSLPSAPPPLAPPLVDDNPDVPWSRAYRSARDRTQRLHDEAAGLTETLTATLTSIWLRREAWIPTSSASFAASARGWIAAGTWAPVGGLAALQAKVLAREADDLEAPTADHARAVAARAEALEDMLRIRAADVAAFDKAGRP